jgi:hypothetical protein
MKNSHFYYKMSGGTTQYLEKKATIKVMGGSKNPMCLGEHSLNIATFIGRNAENFTFPLTLMGVKMGQVSCQITILP